MLQRQSVPHLPPPRPESLIDPPPAISLLPELLEDALDPPEVPQKSNHGGDGSTSSDQPSVPFISPPSPSTPSQSTASTYISFPPHTPSPAPPPARSIAPPHAQIDPPSSTRPQRIRRPRDEWLRDQYVIPERYRQPREPTPVIPSSDEEEDDSDDPLDVLKAHAASTAEPTTYRQSQQRSDADLWHTACQEEMEAHSVNGTWEIVKLPPGKRAIGSRWFLKVKHNADGSLDRYKARLVAKGYSQRPGFDYKETFAPTVRYSTIRIVLALAALEDLELRSVDISHAYLNGTLEEEIYMQQPEGFEVGGPDHVCRLRKSLYVMKCAIAESYTHIGQAQIDKS